jgi:DNA repair protein RadC
MNIFDTAVAEIQVSYHPSIPQKDLVKITTSGEVFEVVKMFWPDFDYVEYFYILLLNRHNKVLGVHQVSKGGFTGTVVDVRVIMQVALKTCCTSLILCHNHPSGNLDPSEADKQITGKIKQAGQIMDIQLLDHLVVCSDRYFSFADEGIL